ncbi:MAG TPA: diphthine--ammonia ligase, partial [Phycisphaerales bacterium]|nr:diphthine--ammonia ligase [Phycisphaerales bacterium]
VVRHMEEKVILGWSGGKDSALALHEVRKYGDYEVAALLTTLTRDYDRICMHGVRSILLEQQAEALGLPLEKIFISKNASNEEYELRMREILEKYQAQGVGAAVFGDVFLQDLRAYREEKLAQIGMKALFPIWNRDTAELACTFIDLGFEAIITCANSNLLDISLVGGSFDAQFLSMLPAAVDPCGENGEFHSFVSGGPIFRRRIPHEIGEVVLRDNGFYYCDLVPPVTADAR